MKTVQLLFYYVRWHYSKAFVDIWRVYTNILWLVYNFFSIEILAKTIFAPWRRLKEYRREGQSRVKAFFANLLINTLMRLVGFCIRLATITLGLASWLAVAIFGIMIYPFWILAPLILAGLLLFSLASFLK